MSDQPSWVAIFERGLAHVQRHLPAMRERAQRRPYDDRRKLDEYEAALVEYTRLLAEYEAALVEHTRSLADCAEEIL